MGFTNFYRSPCFPICLAVELIAGTGCSDTGKHESSGEKPNIILVMIDNVGFPEFGINGNDLVKTPNLDRFASDGIQFSRFYSNPMSAPTRASLMTGRYHYRTGVIHTSRGGAKMHGDEVTIAELLKNEGYTTGIFGKWHLGDNYPMRPQDQGFDETLIHKSGRLGQVPDFPNTYINPKLWENGKLVQKQGYCTDIFFNAAIDFIERSEDRPFFVYLPTNIAHAGPNVGAEVPEKYSASYIDKGLKTRVATVCGMLDNFDENFGRLISRLNDLKLRDKTLVIFLSDDGNVIVNPDGRRGTGYTSPYEGSIRVPCFIQWPGHFAGRSEIDKIASHIDILPTLLDILNITNKPESGIIDGLSLLPLLKGDTLNWPDRMLFLQCHRGIIPHRYQNCTVISDRFKLIGYPNTLEDIQLVISIDKPVLELYDIPADPNETNNLAEKYPEVVERLRKAYDQWFDDVKNSRQFNTGVIHIGSDKEDSTYLSRYQDATYIDNTPGGWPVFIERRGRYEVKINRGESSGEGQLCIQYDSVIITRPLNKGENQATVDLPEGETNLNIWVKEKGKEYVPRPDEDLVGDVLISRK